MKKNGMGSHQSGKMKNDEWLTPPPIVKALGPFDLDPCAPEKEVRPWDTAAHHFAKSDDGLKQQWFGRVWLNPPYGRESAKWLDKLSNHGIGTSLIFARTETDMFEEYVWKRADAILFLKGRLSFYDVNGIQAKANSGAPSVLVAYGKIDVIHLAMSGIPGKLWILNQPTGYITRKEQLQIF